MNNVLPAIGAVISGVFAIVIGYFKRPRRFVRNDYSRHLSSAHVVR